MDIDLNNPEDLQKVFDQMEQGGTLPEITEKTDLLQDNGTPKVDDIGTQDKQGQTDQGQTTDDDAAGVATKDGKHVIPFSVLQNARDRAARAEQLLEEAQASLESLKQQSQSGSQGAKEGEGARTDQSDKASDLSPEDLEALKEDFPTVYKALTATMAQAKALEAQLKPVAEKVHTDEARQARSEAENVQEAIDSIPKLAHIQSAKGDAWALAKQFDATLRTNPAWADKPLAERFGKVAEMVESAIGPIELPTKTSLSPEELAQAARAKAQQAARARHADVPTSLSEFPAGKAAAQSEREAVEQLSHQQLADKLGRMSADEQDAYFATL